MKHVVLVVSGLLTLGSCSEVSNNDSSVNESEKPVAEEKPTEINQEKQVAKATEPREEVMKKEEPKGDESYIGLTLKEAMDKAKAEGRRARPVEIDGEAMMVTRDYRPERLNFTVVKDKVVKVTRG